MQVSTSAEVLPPWKQGDYATEASYTSMASMTAVSSTTQLHMEKHWEQQVAATREVRVVQPACWLTQLNQYIQPDMLVRFVCDCRMNTDKYSVFNFAF